MKSLAHHVANDDVDAIVKAAEALQLRKSGEADRAHAKTMATRTSWADVVSLRLAIRDGIHLNPNS